MQANGLEIRPENPEQDVFMDARQVQAFLGISNTTHFSLMNNEGLPRGVRVGKRAVRYQKSKILEWLATRPASGTSI